MPAYGGTDTNARIGRGGSSRISFPSNPASKLQVQVLQDFTGGVNYRADAFQLHPSESPDLLNVDVSPDGGFQMRNVVGFINGTALPNTPIHSLWQFTTTAGTQQILAGNGTKTHYGTGGNFTDTGTTWTVSDRQRGATFNDFMYIQNGTDAPRKWTGAAISNLTQTFNDNLAAPNGGDMPIARYVCAHRGYMWVARTLEGGVPQKNRVRFSHPNGPEDWRTNDYIDIDIGHEGDEIQAIVPFHDRLLVFKQKSVHAITGFAPDNFAVAPVTNRAGLVGPDAVVSNEDEVFFFSWPDGVFRYDGKNVEWLFNNIYPKIQSGSIPDANAVKIALGWCKRRLWVSTPYGGSSTNARTFVWDPALSGKHKGQSRSDSLGGWVVYDFGLGPQLDWRPVNQLNLPLACHVSTGKVLKLEQVGDQDDFGGGATNITAYYATRWIGDNPAQRKRFRRSDFVVDNDTASQLPVDVKLDWDPSTIKKTFTLNNVPLGSGGVWDTATWQDGMGTGNMLWGGDATGAQAVLRGPSLGSARSAQVTIKGSTPSKRFGVNAITFKYVPKVIR